MNFPTIQLMKKKHFFLPVLVTAVLVVAFALIFRQESQPALPIASATNRQLIPPPPEFKKCKTDSDCVITIVQCSCCEMNAINKAFVGRYANMEKQCKEPPPPCDCYKPTATAKCIDNSCQLPVAKADFRAITEKYPGQEIVASCSGNFLDRKAESAAVIFDKADKKYRVLWVTENEEIQELDTIAKFSDSEFEIQCMDAKKATEFKTSSEQAEGIHTFLDFPKGNGILCYFTDDVSAKCWTFDTQKKALVQAGGWQT